jgi:cytochrome P450
VTELGLLRDAQDPFPEYARMRERGRVHRPSGRAGWVVCGHREAESVLRDHKRFSSEIGYGRMGVGNSMIMKDPPEHTRLRNIVSKAFTPRSIAELEPRIREITVSLLDTMGRDETFDIVERLAIPLPITVIAEMLGIDPADRTDFKRWSNAIIGTVPMPPAQLEKEFCGYFERVIDERRAHPRDDLISRLVSLDETDALTMDELLSFVMLLLVAGNETTTNLIALATLYLSRHQDQRETLTEDVRKIPNAIEEILRYDGPVHMVPPRVSRTDVVLGDVELPAGSWVTAIVAAANRDPERFSEPDTFDITRADASSHVGFGAGIHFCLGAPLARLEGRIALEEMLTRFPSYRLADPEGPVAFARSSFIRTIERLPIVS